MVEKPSRPVKAYENEAFLTSEEARIVRIISEYIEPQRRFSRLRVRDMIVFYGGSHIEPREVVLQRMDEVRQQIKRSGRSRPELREQLKALEIDLQMSQFYDDAMELARRLTEWANRLNSGKRFVICTGAGPGIMEAANRGARAAGGLSIGLNISLPNPQPPNPYITPELAFEFHYFFIRKFWFVYMAAALVVFPGGYGTLDELFEVLTLLQTGKVDRPLPIVIYGSRYWKEVLNFDAMAKWHTIQPQHLDLFKFCDTPDEAFDYLTRTLEKHYTKPVR
ncbi:MAG: LOG family protein [Abditibacteriales bacterium]|nr:LOG family protein [Abditibacteriales bacterium]MDW8368111.1 LOG family protein [Abditibacteriales bacterium]